MLPSNFDICTECASMSMSLLTNRPVIEFRSRSTSGKEMAFRNKTAAVDGLTFKQTLHFRFQPRGDG
jgi:hypothetical protein